MGQPHRWQKGESGNPNGRPRKHQSMTETIALLLDAKGEDGASKREAVGAKLLELALGGSVEALKYLCDRMDGKPAQALEHSGPEGGPITVSDEQGKRIANAVERLSGSEQPS